MGGLRARFERYIFHSMFFLFFGRGYDTTLLLATPHMGVGQDVEEVEEEEEEDIGLRRRALRVRWGTLTPPTFALLLSTTRMLHISTARIDTAIWTQWTVPSRWNSDVDPSGLGEM